MTIMGMGGVLADDRVLVGNVADLTPPQKNLIRPQGLLALPLLVIAPPHSLLL